jgi:hypothetical protein
MCCQKIKKHHMKKVILFCAAALMCMAGLAQEQQEKKESNEYRRTENPRKGVRWEIDTTSVNQDTIWFDEQGNRVEDQDSQNYRQNTDTEMNRNTEQTLDTLQQDVERETREAEQNIRDEADTTEAGREVIQETIRAGEQVQDEAERKETEVRRSMDNQDRDTASASGDTMTASNEQPATGPDIEVVEGKEGPENQVVYKYQGSLWYVDRKKKEMVKANESELKDVKHQIMVHEGTAASNPKAKNKKSKG